MAKADGLYIHTYKYIYTCRNIYIYHCFSYLNKNITLLLTFSPSVRTRRKERKKKRKKERIKEEKERKRKKKKEKKEKKERRKKSNHYPVARLGCCCLSRGCSLSSQSSSTATLGPSFCLREKGSNQGKMGRGKQTHGEFDRLFACVVDVFGGFKTLEEPLQEASISPRVHLDGAKAPKPRRSRNPRMLLDRCCFGQTNLQNFGGVCCRSEYRGEYRLLSCFLTLHPFDRMSRLS